MKTIKKTVRDAVIALFGSWQNRLLVSGGWYLNQVHSLSFEGNQVCTNSEFVNYVDLLASNMGNGNMHELSNYRDEISLGNVPVANRKNQSVELESKSPVFTQEMADNKVMPNANMEVILLLASNNEGVKGYIEYFNDYGVLFRHSHNDFCAFYEKREVMRVKSLTPPITLIGGKAYQFDIRGKYGKAKGIQGIYSEKLRVFQSSSNGFHEETVENIKPLTVEVK